MRDYLHFDAKQKTDLQKKLTSQLYNFAMDTQSLAFEQRPDYQNLKKYLRNARDLVE